MQFGPARNTATFDFLDAAGIPATNTNGPIVRGIADLTTDLKAYRLWDKMKVIYPMVGLPGISSSFEVNLKDPGQFRGTFYGGWTFTNSGAKPNGTGYMDTFYNPINHGLLNSAHLSYYSRDNIAGGTIMLGGNGAGEGGVLGRHYLGQGVSNALNSITEGNYSPSSYAGFHLIKRENSTETKQMYNGAVLETSTVDSSVTPNVSLYVGARNTGGPGNRTTLQCAFASIGDGLTDTEAANLYAIVQKFQTTLGRQV